MGRFYILSNVFAPNTAVTNRALAFIHGFSELGIQAKWVFLSPDSHCSKVQDQLPNIDVIYLWKRCYAKNRFLEHLYLQYKYAKFFYSLKKGDTVLLLGMSAYVYRLAKREGINVFHERTEHPDVVKPSRYQFLSKNYMKGCMLCDGIFVISNALKDYFESCGICRKKIQVINMIVDANRFIGIRKDESVEPYIAYCGNASNSKDGVDDLIKAFAIVASQKTDIKLLVMGRAPEKDSDNEKLVRHLGLESRVYFTGVIPAPEMPQKLKNAKLLALARPQSLQNKYGFPTKLGEYLLTGNPVVITRVGDIPLFLKDGESALMADCHDVDTFAEKILWALDHPKEVQEIGRRGKMVAEEKFNYMEETRKMCHFMFNNE